MEEGGFLGWGEVHSETGFSLDVKGICGREEVLICGSGDCIFRS